MNAKRMIKYSLVLAISLLTACNGGIGGTGGKGGGGGSKQAISVGTVTATGSVQVNGVTFDTLSATVTIDELPVSETKLKQGMVVEVRGSIDSETTGNADTVAAEDVIKGMITSVLAANPNQIEIMGQLVEVNASTILVVPIAPVPTLADFTINELVEVSGFVKANGVVLATRIEKRASMVNFKLKGFIENTLANTFTIGGQTIDYSSWPAAVDDLPGGVPVNGLLVEVKGLVYATIGDSLVATRIELESIRNSEGSQIELEGYVTDATDAPDSFFIGSQEIQTNSSTTFKGGLPADIRLGIEIEVEGQITGGILIADEVEFESNIEVEADTMAVDAGNNTLILAIGTGSLTVVTNENTEISTMRGTGSSLSDLTVGGGDHVVVRGSFDTGTGNIIATLLEQKSADSDVILQGPVTNITVTVPLSIDIMGITVTPDALATYQDQNEMSVVDFAAFQALASVGSIVKAEGIQGVTILWNKLSLEL